MLKLVFIKVKKNLKGLFKIIKNIYIIYELHSTIDGDLCWSEDFGKYDLKLNVLKHGEEGTADGSFTDWRLCCTSVSVCFSSWSGKKFRETAEGNLWKAVDLFKLLRLFSVKLAVDFSFEGNVWFADDFGRYLLALLLAFDTISPLLAFVNMAPKLGIPWCDGLSFFEGRFSSNSPSSNLSFLSNESNFKIWKR